MKKVFLFALICSMFIGCSEEEGPAINKFKKADIVGTWEVTAISPNGKDWTNTKADDGIIAQFSENSPVFEGSYAAGENYIGTYSVSGNNIVCKNLFIKPGSVAPGATLEPTEPLIIGMDYYIVDVYNNVYNKPIDLKKEGGISDELIEKLAKKTLSAEELTAVIEEIKVLLVEKIEDTIEVSAEKREFYIKENEELSTIAMFTLTTTFDDGSKTTQQLKLKKVVAVVDEE